MVKRLAHECKRTDIETEGISDMNEFAPIVSTAAVDFYVLCPQMKGVQSCYQDGLSYRIHVMSEKASSELNGDYKAAPLGLDSGSKMHLRSG